MKWFSVFFRIGCLLVCYSLPARAQPACSGALEASKQLSLALLSRDTMTIKRLVDPGIGYGHSNGWIQTREAMVSDLYDETLRYDTIRLLGAAGCSVQNTVALIRHRAAVAIGMSGTKHRLDLGVLQVWHYRRGRWILIARQACKIS